MKLCLAAMLCLVGGAAAAAPIDSLGAAERPPEICALTVDFGSLCCGTDRAMHERVTRTVIADKGVKRAYSWPWGEEGESTLCLVTRSKADTERLVVQLRAWARSRPNPILTQVWPGPTPHH